MAKKAFTNINRQENLKGGLSHLINTEEPYSATEEEVGVKTEEKKDNDESPRTFFVNKEDFEFLNRYTRYMGFKQEVRYTQKMALKDALTLLREKYPEI